MVEHSFRALCPGLKGILIDCWYLHKQLLTKVRERICLFPPISIYGLQTQATIVLGFWLSINDLNVGYIQAQDVVSRSVSWEECDCCCPVHQEWPPKSEAWPVTECEIGGPAGNCLQRLLKGTIWSPQEKQGCPELPAAEKLLQRGAQGERQH